MSDPTPLSPDPLRAAVPPQGWRDQLAAMFALWNLTPARLIAGGAALGLAVVLAWRVLAPPAPPPEMQIPFAQSASAPDKSELPTDPVATVSSAEPEAEEVVVDVAGAVVTPGVHHLEAGARVVDAVDAAGGLAPDADAARVNLAALLVDGQQVYVARVGETPPVAATAGGANPTGPAPLVDLNTATASELEELPGIGPTTAEAIVDHRERNGPFTSVDDLLDVRGIGDAKLEQLRDRVTV